MKLFAVLSMLITLCACSGTNHSNNKVQNQMLTLTKSGYINIVSPGQTEFNVEHLKKEQSLGSDLPLPEGVDADFRVVLSRIETNSNKITILEHDDEEFKKYGSYINDTDIEEKLDFHQIAIEEFGPIISVPEAPIQESISIFERNKIIIHVSENRLIGLYKIGEYIGGYNRHQYAWSLYEK